MADKRFREDKATDASGKDGTNTNIRDPVKAGCGAAADPLLLPYVGNDGEPRILLSRIPANRDRENRSKMDIILQRPSGTYTTVNPRYPAQTGDWLYLVDYDSQKELLPVVMGTKGSDVLLFVLSIGGEQ
jgi:hypothetical protein